MNYQVGDFILRIKNAYAARLKTVVMPYSNINKAIAKLLVKEKFLSEAKEETVEGKKKIVVLLRYARRKPVVTDVKIVSKPSLRVYVNAKHLLSILRRDAMVTVFSTSQGIMTGKEAKKKGVGGELLFKIV